MEPFNVIAISLLASVLTGAVASLGTVKALHVHIHYLRDGQKELGKRVTRLENSQNATIQG